MSLIALQHSCHALKCAVCGGLMELMLCIGALLEMVRTNSVISKLNRFEIDFRYAAFRAIPVVGNVGEARTWGDAVIGIARRFVINPVTDFAQPLGGGNSRVHCVSFVWFAA